MFKKFLCFAAASLLLTLSACGNSVVEYNSNTGYDGTRDSASQLLIDTNKVDGVDAETGDNEDWYFFIPKDNGFVTVSFYIDSPADIEGTVNVYDGFGRTLHSININKSINIQELPKMEVSANERYFVAIKVTKGTTNYTVAATFELPPPPEIEIVPDDTDTTASSGKAKCVPANKCKAGQVCCKPKQTSSDDAGIPEGAKTIRGTIVLVTPREGGLSDIKINGLGSSKNVKAGMKAILRGLNRKVDLYSCKTTFCNATVKATSEELDRYDSVEVVLE